MGKPNRESWMMHHEIDHIDKLGTRKDAMMTRKDLLKNYIKAARNRKWPKTIDGDVIIEYAEYCLRLEIIK